MPTTTRQSFDQTTRPIFKTYPNIVLLFCIAFGRLRPQCNPAAKKMVQIRVYISPLLTRFLLKITQMCCSYFGPFLSLLFCTICGRLRPQCNPTQKKMVQIRVYIMPFFKAFIIKNYRPKAAETPKQRPEVSQRLARKTANFFYRGRMVPCVQGRFFHFLVCPSAQGFSPLAAQICLRKHDAFSGVDRRLFYLGHTQPISLRNPKTIGKSLGKPFFATERGSPVQGKKAVVFFGVFCGVSEQVFEGPARKTGVAD